MERTLTRPLALSQAASGILGVTLFTLLTALGAFVRIPLPFTPVPVTLQAFFVFLSAVMLGKKAALSQILYLTIGAAGMPVFSGAAGGFAHLLGPTGGYLLGFAAAAWAVGAITRKYRNPADMILALLIGVAIIYTAGAVHLGVLLRLSPLKAVQMGMLPFIIGDLVKVAAVVAVARAMKR
ncbi:MAG: biotin transporter BioY [Candidatus Edwardsbacteria bacterium]|nr:biotin transporter BioY [Candidatus Edwardsbacteria bacterium]